MEVEPTLKPYSIAKRLYNDEYSTYHNNFNSFKVRVNRIIKRKNRIVTDNNSKKELRQTNSNTL